MATAVRSSPIDNSMVQPSTKRKRPNDDVGRSIKDNKQLPSTDEEFGQALLQNMAPQRVAADALAEDYPDPAAFDATANLADFGAVSPTQSLSTPQPQNVFTGTAPTPTPATGEKLANSDEWHVKRRESHKEVERRRREVINEGIDRLAKLVPGPEKNKGAILGRVHLFIESCKDKDVKFDSERQLLRVTVDELTKRNETLRQSARQAWNESNKWQERCRNLGGDFDDYDSHGPHFDESADVDPVG